MHSCNQCHQGTDGFCKKKERNAGQSERLWLLSADELTRRVYISWTTQDHMLLSKVSC